MQGSAKGEPASAKAARSYVPKKRGPSACIDFLGLLLVNQVEQRGVTRVVPTYHEEQCRLFDEYGVTPEYSWRN